MKLLHPAPIRQSEGVAIIRIIIGLLLVYHGQEVFQPKIMETYLGWENFKGTYGKLFVYAGKSAELLAGISLTLGLFTRLGALLCIATLSYITFFVGSGKFWYQDQHPFLFVLFGVLFLFTGPGAWSSDRLWFKSKA